MILSYEFLELFQQIHSLLELKFSETFMISFVCAVKTSPTV